MANIRQAKKRIRQIAVRTARNKSRRSRMRTFIRKVEIALTQGDAEQARVAFGEAMPEMHRSVQKGVLPANRAARKLSRLSKRIKLVQAKAQA